MLGYNQSSNITEPYGFIYCTTNHINGRRYIGQHKNNAETNDRYLGSGKYIKQAFKKYGKKNFSKEILCWANTKEELDRLELEAIIQYDAVNDPSFYNVAEGAYSHLQTDETKEKISKTLTGLKRSEETKQKMSECKKRENLSDETREKLSIAAKNRVYSEEEIKRNKSNLEKYRESEAYKERKLQIAQKRAEKELERQERAKNARTKPIMVRCVETGEEFENLHEAGRKTGIDFRYISMVINGKVKSAKGLHFERIEQEVENIG